MKLLVVFALVALVAARPEEDLSRYDNFDIDEIINNMRLLNSYIDCFLGEGKCTPEGTDIKKMLPDAVSNSCAKCSDKQKVLVAKVIRACQEKLAEKWVKLNKLHNPDGKYDASIVEFLDKNDPKA